MHFGLEIIPEIFEGFRKVIDFIFKYSLFDTRLVRSIFRITFLGIRNAIVGL